MNACYALELISMKMRRQVLWSVNAQLDRVQGKLCVGFVLLTCKMFHSDFHFLFFHLV